MDIDNAKLGSLFAESGFTQLRLAEDAGVSRTRLSDLLKGRAKKVQARTEEKLCRALNLSPGSLEKGSVETAYLNWVKEENRALGLSGLGVISSDEQVSMEDGFVPLTVRGPQNDDWGPRAEEAMLRAQLQQRPLPFSEAMTRSEKVYLLGDPGSGKTTTLKNLARVYAGQAQAKDGYPRKKLVPVFIRLATWAELLRSNEQVDLISAACPQLDVPDPHGTAAWLTKQAEAGKLLVLLDGLDEAADMDYRPMLIERIRQFVEAYPDNRIVISSRIVGFDRPTFARRFDVYEMRPLSDEAIEKFIEQWCEQRAPHKSARAKADLDRQVEQIKRAVTDRPQVKALAGNPMMLTILLLLQRAQIALPQRRFELYQKVIEAFLFSWEEKKRTAMSGAPDQALQLDDREIMWVLEHVAHKMHLQDRTLVQRWWLTDVCTAFLRDELALDSDEARTQTDALLWSLQERAGLLSERGPDRLGFKHLAFQEYFVTRAILSQDDPIKTIQPYIYHPSWREVVRLVSTQLERRKACRLLRLLMADKDSIGAFVRRGLLLSLGCLADGAPIQDKELLKELEQEIVRIGNDTWVSIGVETVNVLAEIQATRLASFARKAANELIASASSRTESFPISFIAHNRGLIPIDEDTQEKNTTKGEVDEIRFGFELALSEAMEPGSMHQLLLSSFRDALKDSSATHAMARLSERLKKISKLLGDGFLGKWDDEAQLTMLRLGADLYEEGACYDEKEGMLLDLFRTSTEPFIKATCAAALGMQANHDSGLYADLTTIATGTEDAILRAGAIRGLCQCLPEKVSTPDFVTAILSNASEDDIVRSECFATIQSSPNRTLEERDLLTKILDESPGGWLLRDVAQHLTTYAIDGRIHWDCLPIKKMEEALRLAASPSLSALEALRSIVDARERRRLAIRPEDHIKQAFSDLAERIELAFVFGSVARGEQGAESDIDLMVIGDVTLKDLVPGLKQAERLLGRQVNAVVYSRDEYAKRCDERHSFVTQVHKGKKLWVIGGDDELAAMVGQLVD